MKNEQLPERENQVSKLFIKLFEYNNKCSRVIFECWNSFCLLYSFYYYSGTCFVRLFDGCCVFLGPFSSVALTLVGSSILHFKSNSLCLISGTCSTPSNLGSLRSRWPDRCGWQGCRWYCGPAGRCLRSCTRLNC